MTNDSKLLFDKLNHAANIIHNNALKGSGNFMIVSLEMAEKIKEADEYQKMIEIKNNRDKGIDNILK